MITVPGQGGTLLFSFGMALVSLLSFSLARRSAGKLARKTKEALQGSEEKYRQVVAAAKDAILVFDAETRQFRPPCLPLSRNRNWRSGSKRAIRKPVPG